MSTYLEAAVQTVERDNDYFTATIVGLPYEISLGRAYTKRKLSHHPTINIDATTAAIWHSDAARALLKQKIKPSSKSLGLPYPAGSSQRKGFEITSLLAFFLGFALCAVIWSVSFYAQSRGYLLCIPGYYNC